jgi:cytoskeleton protein RodZ
MTTIGQKLRESREDQRLTIDKVFEATRIRMQYLRALEEDDLSIMPSAVQARGYLRNYAEFLGLDVDKLLDDLRAANANKPSPGVIGPADNPDVESIQSPEPTSPVDASPVDETTTLIKPKPARRKRADSQPTADSVTTPKRRGRKNMEPDADAEPVLPSEPAIEPAPEVVEETPAVAEMVVQELEIGAEEVPPERVEETPQLVDNAETPLQPDTSDNLWQTWLSRLTSVLAARNKRPTLVPNENVITEIDAKPVLTEIEPAQDQSEGLERPTDSSSQIFHEIGEELRSRREMLSLHLDEVERNTHVKAHYLEALERGAMDALPSTVQTRGMLSNYATFLDLDVDTLLLRFADALQARHRERNPLKPVRKPGQPILANLPPMRSFVAGDLIFGVGIVILLVGFAIWGVNWVLTIQSQREVQPTAPSISDILLASPDPSLYTATPAFVPLESFPGEPTVTVVIPTLNVNVNVQVNLVAVERTYMRVISDGQTVFEGRVVPGTAYPFEAEEQIEVLVGSGAAIRIVYNGRDMGLLGSFGQVVSNIYLATEIITPTGIPSATPTITATPTQTAPPTATSRFTATPVITSTPVP